MSFIDRIFGSYSEKELAKIEPIKKKVLDLDEEYKGLSDASLKAKTAEFRERLANGETLDAKYKDHPLIGDYEDFRECHIKPDWLLIYRIDDEELELYLFRTGTHSDLF